MKKTVIRFVLASALLAALGGFAPTPAPANPDGFPSPPFCPPGAVCPD